MQTIYAAIHKMADDHPNDTDLGAALRGYLHQPPSEHIAAEVTQHLHDRIADLPNPEKLEVIDDVIERLATTHGMVLEAEYYDNQPDDIIGYSEPLDGCFCE